MKLKLLKTMLSALFGTALCVMFLSCQSTSKKPQIEEFTVNLDSPNFQIGEINFQLKPSVSIGKIKKRSATVHYFPKEDAVAVRFRPEFTTFNQCWSMDGRQIFIDALKLYNEDYDARSLDMKAKPKKVSRKYGFTEGYLIWQQHSIMVRAHGSMILELGYAFRDKAPYFVINQLPAEYIDPMSRDQNRKTQVTPFYFTRAQAAELAALFDPEFIDELDIPVFDEPVKGIRRFFNTNKDKKDDGLNEDDY